MCYKKQDTDICIEEKGLEVTMGIIRIMCIRKLFGGEVGDWGRREMSIFPVFMG